MHTNKQEVRQKRQEAAWMNKELLDKLKHKKERVEARTGSLGGTQRCCPSSQGSQ